MLRKFLALVSVAIPLLAFSGLVFMSIEAEAQPAYSGIRFMPAAQVNQILTAAAPSASTDGMDSTGIKGYRVTLCATSGNTLSGAGTLHAYYFSVPAGGLWTRNPGLDLPVTVTATSCAGAACRCQTFPDLEAQSKIKGRVKWATSAVTVSGGTTVDVNVEGWLE